MSAVVIAVSGRTLVVAADTKATILGGVFSSDGVMQKGYRLSDRWSVAFAGDDIHRVLPLMSLAHNGITQRCPLGSSIPAQVVIEETHRAYHAERRAVAEERFLAIYGLDMGAFLKDGLALFGESGFASIRAGIEQVTLSIELLIHGFEPNGAPQLIEVGAYGDRHLQPLGSWAIGSGATHAMSRLALRRQHVRTLLADTIYNVVEAKCAAENASGVGEITTVTVLSVDEGIRVLPDEISGTLCAQARLALINPPNHAFLKDVESSLIKHGPVDGQDPS